MRYIILFLLFALFTFSACQEESDYYKIEGNTQGTTYKLIFQENKHPVSKVEIDSLLHAFDMSLSTYIPNSVISRINENDTTVVLDTFFMTMYDKALEINKATGGAFDITVAPLVNVYGFGFGKQKARIDSSLIDSLLRYVGMSKIRIENKRLIKEYPQTMLDGNAIAQGQAVDVVADFLEQKNIRNYLVEIGGELITKGTKFGQKWVVGIDKPVEGSTAENRVIKTTIQITNEAVATSGNYRKFVIIDGKKYTHSINPKTGFPTFNSLLSATIVAPSCITADAYATACMVSGLEKAKEIVKNNPNLECYFIYEDENGELKEYRSDGMTQYFTNP